MGVAQQFAAGGEEVGAIAHFLIFTLLTFSSSSFAMRLPAYLYRPKYSSAQQKYTQTKIASPQAMKAEAGLVSL